jgi:mannose-1-phosphate guanylyltransferase
MNERCLGPIDCFVLAGGLGTRTRAILAETPKILAPIAGRPYLDYLIDWLCRYGARRIVLGLGHRADAVEAYLAAHPRAEVAIEAAIEPSPLGTAGAIRFARSRISSDPALVVNGDSFVDADLCALVARHRAQGSLGTILCTEVPHGARYGRVEIDRAGSIERFVEKDPTVRGPATINAGVYLLSARLLDEIARGSAASLEREVFQRLPKGTLAAFAGRFAFVDIGTPESLARAAEILIPGAAARPRG